jgi:hypothetical protein
LIDCVAVVGVKLQSLAHYQDSQRIQQLFTNMENSSLVSYLTVQIKVASPLFRIHPNYIVEFERMQDSVSKLTHNITKLNSSPALSKKALRL